jgi:hypothetical protein
MTNKSIIGLVDLAVEAAEFGYFPIPVSGKAPGFQNWQKHAEAPPKVDDVRELFASLKHTGFGILTGTPAGKTIVDVLTPEGMVIQEESDCVMVAIDIDTDDRAQIDVIIEALPSMASPMIKRGAKGETHFFRVPSGELLTKSGETVSLTGSRAYKIEGGEGLLDYLCVGKQSVMPNSLHPDGMLYTWRFNTSWIQANELPVLNAEDFMRLEAALSTLGWKGKSERTGPKSRNINNIDSLNPISAVNRLALGDLSKWVEDLGLYRGGWDGQKYSAVNGKRASSTGRPMEMRATNLSIHPTGIKDFGSGKSYTPIDLVMEQKGLNLAEAHTWLATRVDEHFIDAQDLGPTLIKPPETSTDAYGDWGEADFSLLSDAPPQVPDFPVECFGAAAPYLVELSAATNVRPDYPAAMLLGAVGALVGKIIVVQVNDEWKELLVCWLAMVGPPSSGKTPSTQRIRQELQQLQKNLIAAHERKIDNAISAALELESTTPERLAELEAERKNSPRYILNDTTCEALAAKESVSLRGLLLDRDELAGLIEGLDRYRAGGDRAFYLEAWQRGAFTLERKGSGTTIIDTHAFSITGGIQPDRLRSLLTHSGDDDGFMARVLVFWPEILPPGRIPTAKVDHSKMTRALERIERLFPRPDTNGEVALTFADEAYSLFDDWYLNEHGVRRGTLGKVGSALGKLPGYVVRLAGSLHILDWSFGGADEQLPAEIDSRHMQAALTLVEDYFVPQIHRVYHGSHLSSEERIADAILQECRKRKTGRFNLREVRRGWGIQGCRTDAAAKTFREATNLLVKANLLREQKGKGGALDYLVNPALHGKP